MRLMRVALEQKENTEKYKEEKELNALYSA